MTSPAELKNLGAALTVRLAALERALDIAKVRARLLELERLAGAPGFWDDRDRAQNLLREQVRLQELSADFDRLGQELREVGELLTVVETEEDPLLKELVGKVTDLEKGIRGLEFQRMFQHEADSNNAILSINSGAGGTEAQDWVAMLLRMYLRWCERSGFTATVVDSLPGEQAGFKNVTMTVAGSYAYGYLKAETGIHRLVRISPFDANARRHTSFASVFVIPEISDDIKVEIKESDLRVDTFRASGAGGQHVNKTDSAVRITHLPTGIVVQSQNERSQYKNKTQCMRMLRSRLYEREMEERARRMDQYHSAKKEIGWGSQIRSYVMQPYQLVKDHRTKMEVGNVGGVLDGDLTPLIEAYLLKETGPAAAPEAGGKSEAQDDGD